MGGVAQAEVDRRQVDLAKAHAATLSAQSQVDLYRAQYERLAPAPIAVGTTSLITRAPWLPPKTRRRRGESASRTG